MKFKFSYQKLLEYHTLQEELAQRDFQESLMHLEREKKILADLQSELESATQDSFLIKSGQGPVTMGKLVEIDGFIFGQKKKIISQQNIVKNHQDIVDRKQEILIVAVKEVRIYEKLREKRLNEFKIKMRKKDAKLTDELVVTRFARGED